MIQNIPFQTISSPNKTENVISRNNIWMWINRSRDWNIANQLSVHPRHGCLFELTDLGIGTWIGEKSDSLPIWCSLFQPPTPVLMQEDHKGGFYIYQQEYSHRSVWFYVYCHHGWSYHRVRCVLNVKGCDEKADRWPQKDQRYLEGSEVSNHTGIRVL